MDGLNTDLPSNRLSNRRRKSSKRPAAFTSGLPVDQAAIGIDLGDLVSEYCIYDQGVILERGRLPMTPDAIRTFFGERTFLRVAMEAGAQSPWVTRELRALGIEPIVANPRKLTAISQNVRKSDQNDALLLAKLALADPSLLHPVHHRSAAHADALAVLTARDAAVVGRKRLIHVVRSLVKGMGGRLKKCSSSAFVQREDDLPPTLKVACTPLFAVLHTLNDQIAVYDAQLAEMAKKSFPETAHLLQIRGVGPVTALAFVLTIGDPSRFRNGRIVGAYLGLVPRRDQSGAMDKQLGISKTGSKLVRRLLVQCAQYILGPLGQDCDLRRWGQKLATRGGTGAKKRAVIATARKLAVLLLRLWKRQEVWQPLFNSEPTPDVATPTREDLPETATNDDCDVRLDDTLTRERREADCSIVGSSDPTMHRVEPDPSTSADRSVDTGKASSATTSDSRSAGEDPGITQDHRGTPPSPVELRQGVNATPSPRSPTQSGPRNRTSRSAQAPATPSAPASPAGAGVPASACAPPGRPARSKQAVRPGAELTNKGADSTLPS